VGSGGDSVVWCVVLCGVLWPLICSFLSPQVSALVPLLGPALRALLPLPLPILPGPPLVLLILPPPLMAGSTGPLRRAHAVTAVLPGSHPLLGALPGPARIHSAISGQLPLIIAVLRDVQPHFARSLSASLFGRAFVCLAFLAPWRGPVGLAFGVAASTLMTIRSFRGA